MPLRHLACFIFAATVAFSAAAADQTPAPDAADLQRQLADTQDKLATSLRSYSLLQDENAQLKSDLDKAAAEKAALEARIEDANRQIATLKVEAALAGQVRSLRTQLRQTQDEGAALATENARLRTLLALRAPPPAGSPAGPTRPKAP